MCSSPGFPHGLTNQFFQLDGAAFPGLFIATDLLIVQTPKADFSGVQQLAQPIVQVFKKPPRSANKPSAAAHRADRWQAMWQNLTKRLVNAQVRFFKERNYSPVV
ncbi:hypothetical protein C7T94_09135 [Pedobacter yulinensis]|uniref:Uncharacterized protein n=1 Tax=Pedobacter yulinensis TaxID=2126353 RepID=A0A2T3HK36_9SPHI|nr:hypothetical protein C7T94_09135 [Pedobacter yulinensis]